MDCKLAQLGVHKWGWKVQVFSRILKEKSKKFNIVWNSKLTETQIYRELSIEIESNLFN